MKRVSSGFLRIQACDGLLYRRCNWQKVDFCKDDSPDNRAKRGNSVLFNILFRSGRDLRFYYFDFLERTDGAATGLMIG